MDQQLQPNNKHYIEIKNSGNITDAPEISDAYSCSFKTDHIAASKDLWQKTMAEYISDYVKGDMVGRFGKNNSTINDFCSKIFALIKESVTSELSKKNETTEDLKMHLENVNLSLQLFAKEIEKSNIDIIALSAFLHGFINSYIENVIKVAYKKKTEIEIRK
jgi:hypothetical protein